MVIPVGGWYSELPRYEITLVNMSFVGVLYSVLGFTLKLQAFMIIGPIFLAIALSFCAAGWNSTRLRLDPVGKTLTKSVDCCVCCCPTRQMALAGLIIDSEYIPGCMINNQPAVKVTATDPATGESISLGGCQVCMM